MYQMKLMLLKIGSPCILRIISVNYLVRCNFITMCGNFLCIKYAEKINFGATN